VIVDKKDNLERLDLYLKNNSEFSRSKIQKLINEEKILVNNEVKASSYKVHSGDSIQIIATEEKVSAIKPKDIKIDIVYEDDDLMVINKESGMVVHPSLGHSEDTLVNALLSHSKLSNKESFRPGIVHRLDKDTSGLMLVAKNDWTHEKLAEMIKNKEVERHYLALVQGVIMHSTGTIDAPIGRDPKNRQKEAVTSTNSKHAVTHFKVLKRLNNATLVECILETGRTHQIRVHMQYIKHPIINDPLYNRKKATDFGQMLHSKSIKFIHPRTNKELYFEVEPPQEFLNELENLDI